MTDVGIIAVVSHDQQDILFRDAFHNELDALLEPYGIRYEIVKTENACLIGAASAAFAERM